MTELATQQGNEPITDFNQLRALLGRGDAREPAETETPQEEPAEEPAGAPAEEPEPELEPTAETPTSAAPTVEQRLMEQAKSIDGLIAAVQILAGRKEAQAKAETPAARTHALDRVKQHVAAMDEEAFINNPKAAIVEVLEQFAEAQQAEAEEEITETTRAQQEVHQYLRDNPHLQHSKEHPEAAKELFADLVRIVETAHPGERNFRAILDQAHALYKRASLLASPAGSVPAKRDATPSPAGSRKTAAVAAAKPRSQANMDDYDRSLKALGLVE